MALHTGEAQIPRRSLLRPGRASSAGRRLRALGHGPGQLLISGTTADLPRRRRAGRSGASLLPLGPATGCATLRQPERVFQLSPPRSLRCEFPGVEVARRVGRTNLPVQLNELRRPDGGAGRAQGRASPSTGLVTPGGARGGSGKNPPSRRQVAAEQAEAFPDGVWWVDLAPVVDPDRVPVRDHDGSGHRRRPWPGFPLDRVSEYLRGLPGFCCLVDKLRATCSPAAAGCGSIGSCGAWPRCHGGGDQPRAARRRRVRWAWRVSPPECGPSPCRRYGPGPPRPCWPPRACSSSPRRVFDGPNRPFRLDASNAATICRESASALDGPATGDRGLARGPAGAAQPQPRAHPRRVWPTRFPAADRRAARHRGGPPADAAGLGRSGAIILLVRRTSRLLFRRLAACSGGFLPRRPRRPSPARADGRTGWTSRRGRSLELLLRTSSTKVARPPSTGEPLRDASRLCTNFRRGTNCSPRVRRASVRDRPTPAPLPRPGGGPQAGPGPPRRQSRAPWHGLRPEQGQTCGRHWEWVSGEASTTSSPSGLVLALMPLSGSTTGRFTEGLSWHRQVHGPGCPPGPTPCRCQGWSGRPGQT